MKNRSRMEIAAAILEATRKGSAKTRIMYTAFISYAQTQEYLDLLAEKGLLEYNDSEKRYRTTDAGIQFLKVYDKMKGLLESKDMP